MWTDLKAKRAALPGGHQEFEVTQTFKTASGGSQASKRQIVLDMFQGKWREVFTSGSGSRIRIFDGTDLFTTEEDSNEYIRANRRAKNEEPAAAPYNSDLEWSKASEVERRSCGIEGRNDKCAAIDVPVKPWLRGNSTRLLRGAARLIVDLENGLIVSSRIVEAIDNQSGGYQSDVLYSAKRLSDGAALDASLFQLPSTDMHEVQKLSPWNAARIRKQLAGKPAPELTVTDIGGKPVSLSAFQGRIVLLDFWTTWCPPCRADAPALDKLFRKYGAQDLMIVGVSVSEDRGIVERFLKEHPHSFPVVLTTENEMPRAYQMAEFPTYIVIDRDGTVASAVAGDKGFSELRKLLKKAGLEAE